jgi:hypothetical protein
VAEYLAGVETKAQVQEDGDSGGGSDGKQITTRDRKPPKVISSSDPSSAWTAKANKRVQFGYGLNYLIDVEHAIIVDVEATPARTYDEVASTKTMIERTEQRLDLKPDWLTAHNRLRNRQTACMAVEQKHHAAYPGLGKIFIV